VADEGKKRDFQTKPDSRSVEEKLLWQLFSKSTTEGEKGATVERLKKVTGKDARGLVEKYSGTASSSFAGAPRDLILENSRLIFENTALGSQLSIVMRQREEADSRHLRSIHMAHDNIEKLEREVAHLKGQREHFRMQWQCSEIDRKRERQQPSNLPEIKCSAPGCANVFRPRRRNHKTCSDACRKSLSRMPPSMQPSIR
jgi:hypothetical protein